MLEKILPQNEHAIDRILRVLVGVALMAIVFVGPQTPWGWLGAILVVTGLVGSCPIYTVLGLSTCSMKSGA